MTDIIEIDFLELLVWLIVTFFYGVITSYLFRLATKCWLLWPFGLVIAFSILAYIIVKPSCGCIGFDQVIAAFTLSMSFNLVLFFLAFIIFLPLSGYLIELKGRTKLK